MPELSDSDPGMPRTDCRGLICALLLFTITINYVDRRVLGIRDPMPADEFGWLGANFSFVSSEFPLAYAIGYAAAGLTEGQVFSRLLILPL